MTNLDVGTLSLIAGILIPLVTGLITKFKAPDGVKAFITLALSAAAGAYQTVLSNPHGGATTKQLLTTMLTTWLIAITAHYGLWKPTGASAAIGSATPNFGVGGVGNVAVPDEAPVDPVQLLNPAVATDLATRLGLLPTDPSNTTVTQPPVHLDVNPNPPQSAQ